MSIYFLLGIVIFQICAIITCMYAAYKQEMLHWFIVFTALALLSISEFAVLYIKHIG